jgi:hypothetical protein
MNRKQKIITTIALVVFVLVNLYFMAQPTGQGLIIRYAGHDHINGEAKVAWFMIGVVYAALFFMFKEKKPPQLKQKLEPTTYSPTHHFPQAPQKDGDDDKRLAENHLALSEETFNSAHTLRATAALHKILLTATHTTTF